MENLKIFGSEGKVLLERDLAGEKGPLMILSGETPPLAGYGILKHHKIAVAF